MHVLPVIDEAYFDYLEPSGRLDAIADLVRAGDDVLALRTFSKLYGLAGLRVGYGVGPAAVVAAMRKVQRGYDVGAARAGRRAREPRRRGRGRSDAGPQTGRRSTPSTAMLQARGLEPLSGSVTNFVLVDVGTDADRAAKTLLADGVAVQSGVAVRRSDVAADRRGHERPSSRCSTPPSPGPGSRCVNGL